MLRCSRISVCVLLLWGGAGVAFAQDNDPLIGQKAGQVRQITFPDNTLEGVHALVSTGDIHDGQHRE